MTYRTFEGRLAAKSPWRWRTIALATAPLLLGGCSLNSPSAHGALIVDWTLRGGKDPRDCQAVGAKTLHVSLSDSSGVLPMEYVQDCASFATTIGGLVPDMYTGTVELTGATGNALTTMVALAPFRILPDQTVTVPVDFPANSFFAL